MKRLLTIVLALVLVAALPACASSFLDATITEDFEATAYPDGDETQAYKKGDKVYVMEYCGDTAIIYDENNYFVAELDMDKFTLDNTPVWPDGDVLELAEEGTYDVTSEGIYAADIDGDGVDEQFAVTGTTGWDLDDMENSFSVIILRDNDKDYYLIKGYTGFETFFLTFANGKAYFVLSGDMYAQDYITSVVTWDGTTTYYVPFADTDGIDTEDMDVSVVDIQDGVLYCERVFDILGEWWGTCEYVLGEDKLTPTSDSWIIPVWDDEDYPYTLTTSIDITGKDGSFAAGTSLRMTETDNATFVVLSDAEGNEVEFEIAFDWENLCWTLNGVPETEIFPTLVALESVELEAEEDE